MSKFNAGQSFADGDTVTGAKLNNIAGLLDIYTGLISEQTAMSATVSTADQLLIADVDNGDSGAANRVTVQKLLNDTLTNGTFTDVNLTGNLNVTQLSTLGTLNNTRGTVGILNSTTGTIQSLTSSTANISQGSAIFTQGTIGTLNSTTGTIGTLVATGTITGSTNVINIGGGQIYKDSSGNVGIGTASPAYKLDVSGDIGVGAGNKFTTVSGNDLNLDAPTTRSIFLKIAGSTKATIDSSGQVGVGVTPSGWGASEYKAIQVGIGGSISGRVSGADQDKVNVAANVYNDGANFRYIASDDATIYQQTGGIHTFSNATSGTAGSTATFTERLRIDTSGNVSIGTATALSKLHVHGDLTMSNATTAVTAATGGVSKPATYAGFLTVSINGTSRKIPYYA